MTSENKQWTLPDPKHVMECIERWRELDLRKKSDSEIDLELSGLLDSLKDYSVSPRVRIVVA